MAKRLNIMLEKIIEYSYYLLFLLTPLVLTPVNYELFEYNKMTLTYILTVIILGSFLIKSILEKQLKIRYCFWTIPLLLFLASQILSTVFSIDPHLSIFGYYSRLNGGLLSTVSYLILFFVFVSCFPKEKIPRLLKVILFTALIVSFYGILEHYGIDKDLWVQDVQNRVFSTLGQPNWLAAYIAVLIPLTIGLGFDFFVNQNPNLIVKSQKSSASWRIKIQNENVKSINWTIAILLYCITVAFYLTLIFTKSRSGFLGFWIANGIFWLLLFIKFKKPVIRYFFILTCSFLIINFLFGTPFVQLNRFSLSELISKQTSTLTSTNNQQITVPSNSSSIIDVGITESGQIRNIVWKGATQVFANYPIFGSGVETFALSYYRFRPLEHNMTSEWDFLYNKAHNEYLNFAANTGFLGLGSYLLLIIIFILVSIKKLKVQSFNIKTSSKFKAQNNLNLNVNLWFLSTGLFCGWLSILITNFFGFSVVVIQLFFFLIPAILFVISDAQERDLPETKVTAPNKFQTMSIVFFLSVTCYLLYTIGRLWYADTIFAMAYRLTHSSEPEYLQSYQLLKQAIKLNWWEPLYFDELALPAAQIAVALDSEKMTTTSAQLADEAILASNIATTISPNNVNYWKSKTRIYYALSAIDEKYLLQAVESLKKGLLLSPTDAKITYNLALLYDRLGETNEATNLLQKTIELKSNYKEAYLALGLIYQQKKEKTKAYEMYTFVLEKLDPYDEIAKTKIAELK